ncbi:unnamed protein product [Rotaria sordida]|uniref:Uncharacterized protein n=1 Tax=Rotaria sordida TaxID=392033 RepID=A0A819VXR4_9BILA|nr:unnamed protein product [Rotaria sordida]CAF4161876.1 unnamed protein product [Rotaria sordida]
MAIHVSSLPLISTLPNSTHYHENNKTYSSLIQISLENLDISSDLRSINCLNLLDLALKRFENFHFFKLINIE